MTKSETPAGPVLLVFLKAPVPGGVKTRLAKDIGDEDAVKAYREMASRVRDHARAPGGAAVRWVYDASPDFPDLGWLGLAGEPFRPQAPGDLGARLSAAFREAFAEGFGPICAIGTDSPGIGPDRYREAFDALRVNDLVAGPTEDGGYYLIGTKAYRPELFDGIPWSTPGVMDATRDRARRAGLRAAWLALGRDIDTAADFDLWKKV